MHLPFHYNLLIDHKDHRSAFSVTAIWVVFILSGCSFQEPSFEFKISPVKDIVKAQQFELKNVRLLDSPFRSAMYRDGMYLLSLDPDRLLAPYWKEAGVDPEAENYGGWESTGREAGIMDTGLDGHSLGHYLTALSMMTSASDDPRYQERVDYIVKTLAVIQNEIGTGYLSGIPNGKEIFEEIGNGTVDATPFGLNDGWVPWYNIHKLFAGLRDAHIYAGNKQAKEVLIGLSDWAVTLTDNLDNEQFKTMIIAEYGGMNEVLTDVYALTGDDKYLSLASRFHDWRVFSPLSEGKDQLAGLHANTQIPKIIGAARAYEMTGIDSLHRVATFFWDTVIENRTYANGGNSLQEHFGELGTLQDRLGKTTSESCNTYNMLKLTEHLMQWYPDEPKYAEYYEKALYNHILASQDPKTGQFCYFVPLESGHFKTFSSPENSFWCCVGSGMENHTKYGKNIYLHTENSLYVNLFIPSELNWTDKGIVLLQETNFPNSPRTSLRIQADSPAEFELKIRKPAWVTSAFSVLVNGEIIDATANSAHITVNRTWKDGDLVEVELPMDLHIERLADDDRKVAIKYGPILLAGKLGAEGMDKDPIPYAGYEGFDGHWDHLRYENMETVDAPSLDLSGTWKQSFHSVEEKPLHFTTTGIGQPNDVELAPFYEVNHVRYAIYWDIIVPSN